MIQSMTGFGRGEAANEKYKVTIEMKSVNHRYLDLSVRLPRKLNFYEPAIRNQVKEFAKRGKIDIFVSMEQLQENAESIQYNPQIAAAYLSGISQMADEFSVDGTIQAYQLARFPDVFTKAEEDDNEEEWIPIVTQALRDACEKFAESRRIEGEKLAKDLSEKLDHISDLVDKIEKSDCNNSKNYVSLLSMNDYIDAGANNSYLNNNTYFWLSALNENEPWYVFDNGGLKTDSNNHIYGVRPVIVLNDIEYIYGNGTKSSPYIISNEPVDTLSEIELGSYIDYSGYTWKVVSKDETSVKVVLSTPLKLNDEEIKKIYSKKYNYYNLNDSTGIAYYLNHTFYNTLKDKKYLKKGDFYIGKSDTYDLEELYNEKVNAYVGLLTVGDIFVTQNIDMYLLSSVTDDNTIPILNKNNSLFYNFISYESGIKPVIYLDNKVEVKGGMGDENYPFELR